VGAARAKAESGGRKVLTRTDRSPLWLVLQHAALGMYHTLFDLEVYGVDNVPATGGAILAANHQSYLDPPAVAGPLTRPVSFMAKSELFENPYFGWLIRNLHAFPIRQGRGDKGALTETVMRLQEGALLNMYPEGSRSEDGEMAPLEKGIALVVRKARVPVVPVAIDGSFDAWPKGRKLFRPGKIRVLYGPPIELHELPGDELVKRLERVLRGMFEDLRAFPKGASGEPRTARATPV
jgi:1-acyl-sn-glycerol-3-phosphate acyltransferase